MSDQTVANDPDTGIQDSGDANLITADMIDEENKAHEESQKEFEARLWETVSHAPFLAFTSDSLGD